MEDNKPIVLEGKIFLFIDNCIGTASFKGARFDAYSLSTLLYGREEQILTQIKNGMKIIDNNNKNGWTDMDDAIFNALMEYGKIICE